MRIKYSRKLVFYYVAVICTTTVEAEKTRACVSRYDQFAWNANQGRRNRVNDGAPPPAFWKGEQRGTRALI